MWTSQPDDRLLVIAFKLTRFLHISVSEITFAGKLTKNNECMSVDFWRNDAIITA